MATKLKTRGVELTFDASPAELKGLFRTLNDPELVRLYRGSVDLLGETAMETTFREWASREWGHFAFVRHGDKLLGLVYEYGRSLLHQHTRVSAVLGREHIGQGRGALATGLFVHLIFTTLPVRQVLMEAYSYNFPVVSALRRLSHFTTEPIHEVILRDYRFDAGNHWDLHTFQIRRDQFDEIRQHFFSHLPPVI